MNDKTVPCHDSIWLINMGDEIVWSDDPNPSGNVCPDDVRELVSAEKYHGLAAQLKTSRRDYEVMNKFREGAEAERDALAAHVERLHALFVAGFESGDGHDLDVWETEAKKVLSETPETSLARLKAKWQAETLEGVLTCCEKCPPGKSHKDVLRVVDQMARAQRDLIRRQAGGDL